MKTGESMSDPHLEHRVREIIAEQLGIGEEDISLESTFTADLGADSLDFVELMMALEEEFEIDISEEVSERLESVGDVIRLLEGQVN